MARAASPAGPRAGGPLARPDRPPGGGRPARRRAPRTGWRASWAATRSWSAQGRAGPVEGGDRRPQPPAGGAARDARPRESAEDREFVHVRVSGRPVVVVNGHYFWPPGCPRGRVRQVGRVLDRLGTVDPGGSAIVCGDFNGLPGTPAIDLMAPDLRLGTRGPPRPRARPYLPDPLVGGPSVRSAITRGALRLFTNRPGESWRGTLDYIFVSPDIRVLDCGVFLDRPADDDPGLYAVGSPRAGGDPGGRAGSTSNGSRGDDGRR